MTNSVRAGFAARFRRALAEAGHGGSQLKELGILFGVTGQAARKWLGEEAMPSSLHAAQIAMQLGVRRAWLLDGEEPMRSPRKGRAEQAHEAALRRDMKLTISEEISEEERRMLSNYRSLSRLLQLSVQEILENISREVSGQKRKRRGQLQP